MSTKAQILANRNNSQKSTGPQTDEGKAVVSLNAVKHGIFAGSVIQGEDPADYEAFHDQFLAELAPVGTVESMLAERIVSLWWRLQRAERMQNESIEVLIAKIETDPWQKTWRERAAGAQDSRAGESKLLLGWATKDDFSHSRVLDRLLMYERRIENSVIKIMKELKRFQVMRRIELQNAEKIEPSLKDEAAAPKTEKHGDLKKQSQYAVVDLGARSYIKRDYGNKPAGGDDENKANRSQSQALESTKGVGKREKSVTAANSLTG